MSTFQVAPAPPANARASVPERRHGLLVVDDDEGPREALRMVFGQRYEVWVAENGEEALALARAHPIDVAIVDLRMPGLSGLELLDRLRGVDPMMSTIILTGFETLDSARQALRLGAFDYVSKPFDVAAMRATVEAAIERRLQLKDLTQIEEALRRHRVQEEVARTQNEIYAGLLHDINAPMTFIACAATLLQEELRGGKNSDTAASEIARRSLAELQRQADHCIQISRRYLQLMRQQAPEAAPSDPNRVLEDFESLLRGHPAVGKHQLVVRRLETQPNVSVAGFDLTQILMNLTLNALQATSEPHRVEVVPQLVVEPLKWHDFGNRPGELLLNREQFVNRPPILAVCVADNGPGMTPEVLANLFRPFFSTKQPGQGSGIGLAVAHRLTRANQGALHVQTKVGEGTRFTVYLPLMVSVPSAGPAATASPL